MPQRNLGRQVARAAASGGGRAYHARPAIGWYLTMLLIVVLGVSLVVYSRQEAIHPKTSTPAKSAEGPNLNDSWHAALSLDICGKLETLPVNSNLTATGLRTFGDGLIYIQPSVVGSSKASAYEGENANLLTFATKYPNFTLTTFSIKFPKQKLYTNGNYCTPVAKNATAAEKAAAQGTMEIETWASPTAKGVRLSTPDPVKVHLTNGEMISVGFLTKNETLPVPASKSALEALLPAPTVTSTTAPKTTATTAPKTTTTTAPKSTSTT